MAKLRHLAILASTAFLGAPVGAQPAFYHSPTGDGTPPAGTPSLPPGGGWLSLYVDAGPTPTVVGTACEDGDGDEKCAWEFAMVGLGALALGPFVGADGVESVTDGFVLSANAVRGTSPTIGPEYIGRLFVSSSGGGGPVLLLSGGAIGADLGYDAAAAVATIVTVPLPEPGVPLMTGAGVLGLAFLERRLARRRAAALGR
jgi:hypothetical protein